MVEGAGKGEGARSGALALLGRLLFVVWAGGLVGRARVFVEPAHGFVGQAGGLVGRGPWSGVLALLGRLSFVVRTGVFVRRGQVKVGPARVFVGPACVFVGPVRR